LARGVYPPLETRNRDSKETAANRLAPIVRAYAFREGRSYLAGSIQIDTIKWLIAKIAPRRYGEKVVPDATVKVSIGDGIEKGRKRVVRRGRGEVVSGWCTTLRMQRSLVRILPSRQRGSGRLADCRKLHAL